MVPGLAEAFADEEIDAVYIATRFTCMLSKPSRPRKQGSMCYAKNQWP